MANFFRNLIFGGAGAATAVGDVGLAIARVTTGFLMAYGYGVAKVFHEGSIGPTADFVRNVDKLGFPQPTLFAWMAVLTEFVGATLVALGLMTRPAALALAFNMTVAAFVAHGSSPLFAREGPSKEGALLYLAPFLMFVFTGAGRYSLDALFNRKKPPRPSFDVGTKR